jgi:hypothetical protein
VWGHERPVSKAKNQRMLRLTVVADSAKVRLFYIGRLGGVEKRRITMASRRAPSGAA